MSDAKSSPQMYATLALVLGTFFIGIPLLVVWGVRKAVGSDDNGTRSNNPSLEETLKF